MKKTLFIPIIAILCWLFCSCQPEQGESDMKPKNQTISVTLRNDAEEADIWILPQTAQNLKTTVWGTPTFSKVKAGERQTELFLAVERCQKNITVQITALRELLLKGGEHGRLKG